MKKKLNTNNGKSESEFLIMKEYLNDELFRFTDYAVDVEKIKDGIELFSHYHSEIVDDYIEIILSYKKSDELSIYFYSDYMNDIEEYKDDLDSSDKAISLVYSIRSFSEGDKIYRLQYLLRRILMNVEYFVLNDQQCSISEISGYGFVDACKAGSFRSLQKLLSSKYNEKTVDIFFGEKWKINQVV
jgi:hypothetical protein